MRYALENIETIINVELHPDQVGAGQLAREILAAYMIKITQEKHQVRMALIEEVFTLKKEKLVESFIQRYQSAIINLADDIFQFIRIVEASQPPQPPSELTVVTVYRDAIKCLEELLTFLEKKFNRYFNVDEKIPESHKILLQSKFSIPLKAVQKQYKNIHINNALLELVSDPFQKFIKAGIEKQYTYRQVQYLKTLQEELAAVLSAHQKSVTQAMIMDLLLYLNYNNHSFINYYISHIASAVNEVESVTGQSEKLAWWLKTISQVQVNSGIGYKIKDPSAKEQLIGWIADEMAFIDRKQERTSIVPANNEKVTGPNFSVKTTLSVKQLALFTRLLVDTGAIETPNITALLAFIAENISTGKAEAISATNFRIRYYDTDEPTKRKLKEQLMDMINYLHNY